MDKFSGGEGAGPSRRQSRWARIGLIAGAALASSSSAQAQPANLAGFDKDADGRTSRAEYRTGLVSESMKFDRDGDGRVTVRELPAFARIPGLRGRVERIFRSNDLSGDGALSRDELVARAETRFSELDADRDGFLDAGEIKAARRGAGR